MSALSKQMPTAKTCISTCHHPLALCNLTLMLTNKCMLTSHQVISFSCQMNVWSTTSTPALLLPQPGVISAVRCNDSTAVESNSVRATQLVQKPGFNLRVAQAFWGILPGIWVNNCWMALMKKKKKRHKLGWKQLVTLVTDIWMSIRETLFYERIFGVSTLNIDNICLSCCNQLISCALWEKKTLYVI